MLGGDLNTGHINSENYIIKLNASNTAVREMLLESITENKRFVTSLNTKWSQQDWVEF